MMEDAKGAQGNLIFPPELLCVFAEAITMHTTIYIPCFSFWVGGGSLLRYVTAIWGADLILHVCFWEMTTITETFCS